MAALGYSNLAPQSELYTAQSFQPQRAQQSEGMEHLIELLFQFCGVEIFDGTRITYADRCCGGQRDFKTDVFMKRAVALPPTPMPQTAFSDFSVLEMVNP